MSDAKPKGIRVRVDDLETGDAEQSVIWNDYLLICAGDRELTNVQAYPNGTHVITIKRRQ